MAKTKKCPVCGISTKVENLEKHLKKVHPGERVELDYTEKEQVELKQARNRDRELASWGRNKTIAVLVVIMLVIGAIFAYVSIQNDAGSGEPPNVVFDHSSFDFGTVSDPKTVYHDFAFENAGSGALRIDKVQTSCHCTTVVLEIDDSPEGPFGMDGSPGDWKGSVGPGGSVVLKVTYDTLYHGTSGDHGEQTRIVNLYTNDPTHPTLKFELKMFIVRN